MYVTFGIVKCNFRPYMEPGSIVKFCHDSEKSRNTLVGTVANTVLYNNHFLIDPYSYESSKNKNKLPLKN